jgi:hypothetical protein
VKYFELFNATGFHTTIATTFCVDFAAYEAVALARLREAGSTNNVLLADERMLAQALADEASLPQHAGRRYSVLGARARGVFHPKLILQLGKSEARLVVASANLTAPGMGGNLEVMGQLHASEGDLTFAPVIRQALTLLTPMLQRNSAAARQLDWALAGARWFERVTASETIRLQDGGVVGFLADTNAASIGRRFVELVGDRDVHRLIVASPYWDDDLSAVRDLATALGAREVCLAINPGTLLFPAQSMQAADQWRLHDIFHAGDWAKGRFAHAKVFIAQTADADCVLYGSANCTQAALGLRSPALNVEASFYRELLPGQAVDHLKLEGALGKAAQIRADQIPSFEPGEAIPLEELAEHLPGTFILSGRTLAWTPPAALLRGAFELEFYQQNGLPMNVAATAAGEERGNRYFTLDGELEPHFARVCGPGFRSSLGVVLLQHEISRNQRGAASKAVRDALDFFDEEEACEGTWILEVIQTLSRNERPELGDRRKQAKTDPGEQPQTRTLTYEEFIRGREQVANVRTAASSLASSHMDTVRAFLNYLIGRTGKPVSQEPEAAGSPPTFGMGDETDDAENSIEDGAELNERADTSTPDAEARRLEKLRRYQQYVKDTQASIVEAVASLIERTRERANSEELTSVDVLRLRALLMVVLSSGTSKPQLLQADLAPGRLRRQVLPSRGEANWQLLVGKLLFAFFRRHQGEAPPLVCLLKVENEKNEGLPIDLLEAWATCVWAACATLVSMDSRGTTISPSIFQVALTPDVYAGIALPEALLDSPVVTEMLDALTQRYAVRLGVDAVKLSNLHRLRGHLPRASPMVSSSRK